MKACKFGILFFGMGLSMTRGKHLNAEAALSLARDLNEYTPFLAKPMRGHGNVTGADNVVALADRLSLRRQPGPARLSAFQPRRVHHLRYAGPARPTPA